MTPAPCYCWGSGKIAEIQSTGQMALLTMEVGKNDIARLRLGPIPPIGNPLYRILEMIFYACKPEGNAMRNPGRAAFISFCFALMAHAAIAGGLNPPDSATLSELAPRGT